MQVYLIEGPVPEDLREMEPDIVFNYDESGRTTSRTEYGIKTIYSYDESGRLVEEKTLHEEHTTSRVYEYDPDGEVYHIHTDSMAMYYQKGCAVLPNGNFDITRTVERVEMVPAGGTTDEWISWEEGGTVRRTETVMVEDDGRKVQYTTLERFSGDEITEVRYINADGTEETHTPKDFSKMYHYDEENEDGSWTRCHYSADDGTLMTIIRVFEYWE